MTSLADTVKKEIPHLQYVVDTLHSQGLQSGALPDIIKSLRCAVYDDSKNNEKFNNNSR